MQKQLKDFENKILKSLYEKIAILFFNLYQPQSVS
jgi:hypothetical protein